MTEDVKTTGKEMDELDEHLQKEGYAKKTDFDNILEMSKDATVYDVINHNNCNKENCAICGMKGKIDQDAFKRGTVAGIRLGRKYPGLKVE